MIHAINNIACYWWSWMAAMFWQVSLLIIIIACLDKIIKRWAWPQLRYALWLLVLLKLVLPPGISMPGSLTERLQPQFDRIISRNINEPSTITQYSQFIVSSEPVVSAPAMVPQQQEILEMRLSEPDVETSAEVMSESPAVGLVWQFYAFLLWLLGMTVLGFWLIFKLHILRVCQSQEEFDDSMPQSFHRKLTQCAAQLKLGRIPRVVVTGKVVCPAVFGIFRPVLLMPKGYLSKLSRKGAEHILLHELAHIKRGDTILHSFYLFLQIIYWFNPLLWLARRQLIHLRELCCDAAVARILKYKTKEYRQTLIEIARRFLTRPVEPSLGLLGLFEDTNRLQVRLSWLEKKTWRYHKMKNLIIITIITLMFVFVLPMAKAQEQSTTEEHTVHSENLAALEKEYKQLIDEEAPSLEMEKLQVEIEGLRTAYVTALEQENNQLMDEEVVSLQMEKLQDEIENLEIRKQNLQKELEALVISQSTAETDKQLSDAQKIRILENDYSQTLQALIEKYKQQTIQKELDESLANSDIVVSQIEEQLAEKAKAEKEKQSKESKEIQKMLQQMEQLLNNEEFEQSHQEIQLLLIQMHQLLQEVEHSVQVNETHKPTVEVTPESAPSVDIVPMVTVPNIEIPEIVIPRVSSPTAEVPVHFVTPIVTLPGSPPIEQPGQLEINVQKDEDNKFVATREMEFITKIQPEADFVVENNIGNIILSPSQDSNCTVKAVIRASAETSEKAQELIEQVAMHTNSNNERFYFRPVRSGDDNWDNLSVNLHVALPYGVDPNISTNVGSIEISGLQGQIIGMSYIGSIKTFNITGQIQLTTYVGDIEFVADDDFSAQLKANTEIGSIESEFPLDINQVNMLGSTAEGTIGSGEKNVSLTTEVGKISIRKQPSVEVVY